MILIGSRALNYWYPEQRISREDSDYDVVVPSGMALPIPSDVRFEVHEASHLNNQYILDNFGSGQYVEVGGVKLEVCSLEGLAAIKRSHLWRDHFWDKHIAQYNSYLRQHLTDDTREFLDERVKLTKADIRYTQPSLRQSNEDFFDDAVTKVYDHDWLHELAAYGDEPLYLSMKRDFDSAWCERDMWDQFSHEQKIMCTAEECYVIAMERFLIPNNWDYSYVGAYLTALKKVCTTLCSGWFRDFAIDNHQELVLQFEKSKLERLKEIINEKAAVA